MRAVAGPTPQMRSTSSAWRNSSSPSGSTTNRPSGLAERLAIFASTFVRATPTLSGRPASSRTSRRSRRASSTGSASSSETSRNASSIDPGCTTGVIRRKISNTAALAALIESHAVSATTRSGHWLPRPRGRHPAPHPVRPRLVRRRHHDPRPDGDRAGRAAPGRRAGRPRRRTRRRRRGGALAACEHMFASTAPSGMQPIVVRGEDQAATLRARGSGSPRRRPPRRAARARRAGRCGRGPPTA